MAGVFQAMVAPKKPDGGEHLPLASLHQRTIGVQLSVAGDDRLLVGRGIYEHDAALGEVLRIQFAADPESEFVIAASQWRGEILPGQSVGCDFLIRLI